MGRQIRVYIDSDDMIEMLWDRMSYWTKTNFGDEFECYCQYLEELVESGAFDDMQDFDPMVIVDNIYVNDTAMLTPDSFSDYDFDPEVDDGRLLANVGKYYLIDAH